MKALQFLRKWLFCSWAHSRHRCYPAVHLQHSSSFWHCTKCHPCEEEIDAAINAARYDS